MSAQSMEALQCANAARTARRLLKEDIAAGRVSLLEILETRPEPAASITLYHLLKAQPFWGETKAKRALRACGVSQSTTLRGATDRQRFALWERLA